MRAAVFLITFGVLGLLENVAVAQANGSIATARELYQRGAEAYEQEQYTDALAAFRESYEIANAPELLFNIAITLEKLGRTEEAAAALRTYLAEYPDAEDHDQVERRLDLLSPPDAPNNERSQVPNTDIAKPTVTQSVATGNIARRHAGAWTAGAFTVAFGALAAGSWGRSGQLARMPADQLDVSKIRRLERTAQVSLGLLAVSTVVGVTLLVVDPRAPDDPSASVSLHGSNVRLSVDF